MRSTLELTPVRGVPQTWSLHRIDDLGELKLGKMLDRAKNSGTPAKYLRNVNVRWFSFDLEDLNTIHISNEELLQFSVKDGDLFICEGGEPGRCAVWIKGESSLVYQKALHRFRSNGAILPKILMYRLKHDAESGALAKRFTGSTIKHLTRESLASHYVPVPPLPEQKRIADKLDRLLARVDACHERLNRVPTLLKRFRQSVLAAATSGELTREWREENGWSDSWTEVTLKDIAEITGGVTKDSKKESSQDEEVPYLRVANVQRGYIDLSEVKTIRVPKFKLNELLLEPGDVLFNEGGDIDKLGRGWVWEGQIPRCTFQNHVFRARLRDKQIQPKYISWWGNSRGLDYFIRSGKQTTNLASINKSVLSALPILLPPSREQAEIVVRVESLLTLADEMEARFGHAMNHVNQLAPATLAKAFRGELVPQEPNDEPASVLLARSLAQQIRPKTRRASHSPPSHSSRRHPAPKETATMTKSRQDEDVMGQPYLAGHLRRLGTPASAEALFKLAELPVADFYKQLAWEVEQGHIKDNKATLEPGYAAR